LDLNTLFVVGEDDSLYVKVFNFVDQNSIKETKKDFTLRKESISLLKLYKFDGKVTDMFIHEQQKHVYILDRTGMLYKLQ